MKRVYRDDKKSLEKRHPKVKFIEIQSKAQMQHLESNCKEVFKPQVEHRIAIHFETLRKDQEEMVRKWLHQDYVSQFWYGVGLENTLMSISRFVNGEETLYTLWIAYDDSKPFGYLMVSNVDLEKDDLYAKHLSGTSKAITLDLLIGDPSYLGRGLSYQMIQELLLQKYSDKTDVFIDPGTNNPKAIHVYEKAGFEKLEEFIPDWDPSHPCLLMHLNMEKLKCGK